MTTVYVVMHGDQCEGGTIVSVHRKHSDATQAALNYPTHFSGDWVRGPEDDYYEEHVLDYWVNGCDFISVEWHQVA